MNAWHNESSPPTVEGWFEVMRSDGSLCCRAFGNGFWWIPLPDGWISGLPSGFKWRGPIAPFGDDKSRSPLDEATEAMLSWAAMKEGK